MSCPGIDGVTTITGKTSLFCIYLTLALLLLVMTATVVVYKINTIIVSNIDGTNTANITVRVHPQMIVLVQGPNHEDTIDVMAD